MTGESEVCEKRRNLKKSVMAIAKWRCINDWQYAIISKRRKLVANDENEGGEK